MAENFNPMEKGGRLIFNNTEQLFNYVRETIKTPDNAPSVPGKLLSTAPAKISAVQIGENHFDLNTPAGIQSLSTYLLESSFAIDTEGDFISVSDQWRSFWVNFPSFTQLHWPGYSTTFRPLTIDGHDVIVQVWKGHCQRFFNFPGLPDWLSNSFPGGYGAEVGIYYIDIGRDIAMTFVPFIMSYMVAVKLLISITGRMWWPMCETPLWSFFKAYFSPEISFDLYFKEKKLFSTNSQLTWWKTQWLNDSGFDKYLNDNFPGTKWSPEMTKDMNMFFSVNGHKFEWIGDNTSL